MTISRRGRGAVKRAVHVGYLHIKDHHIRPGIERREGAGGGGGDGQTLGSNLSRSAIRATGGAVRRLRKNVVNVVGHRNIGLIIGSEL